MLTCTHSNDATHSFIRYGQHPRFGEVKVIVTTAEIAAGSELTVDYDFEIGPEWYRNRHG